MVKKWVGLGRYAMCMFKQVKHMIYRLLYLTEYTKYEHQIQIWASGKSKIQILKICVFKYRYVLDSNSRIETISNPLISGIETINNPFIMPQYTCVYSTSNLSHK